MLWCWILGVFIALLFLLCITRVGVRAAFDGELKLDAKFGWFHFRILPLKKRRKEAGKKAEKKPEKKKKPEKEKKPFPKPSLSDIKEAVRTLWPPLKKALGRTWRGIHIDPLRVSLTVGGKYDPASAAELYGYLQGGVWTAMPQLERLMDIPDPRIHLDIDFTVPQTSAKGEAGISIRIGTLLLMGLGIGIPALRWFLRFRKRKKQESSASPPGKQAA